MPDDHAPSFAEYKRLRNDEEPFTTLQEWQCEPA